MKTLLSIFAAIALSAALRGAPVAKTPVPDEVVIVTSRYGSAASIEAAYKLVFKLLLVDLPGGTQVSMWDGATTKHIFMPVNVPKLPLESAEARAAVLAEQLHALKQWSEESRRAPRVADFSGTGAILLPQTLAKLSPRSSGGRTRILILASPLYRSSSEKSWSMAGNLVPSDGTLDGDPAKIVYATRGREQALAGVSIYWGFGPEVTWVNHAHFSATKKWWSIWTESQGGVLVTTVNDFKEATAELLKGSNVPQERYTRDRADKAIEMRPATDQALPVQAAATPEKPAPEPAAKPPAVTSTPPPKKDEAPPEVKKEAPVERAVVVVPATKPVTPPPPPPPPVVEAPARLRETAKDLPVVGPGRISIAALWESDRGPDNGIDLDVFVEVAGVPGQCWWKSPFLGDSKEKPIVRLLEDIRQGRGLGSRDKNMRATFEFVEINKEVRPDADVNCWVEIYENKNRRPVRALVRMEYQGKIYEEMVEFPAMAGDKAAGRGTKDTPAWRKINLGAMLARGPIG